MENGPSPKEPEDPQMTPPKVVYLKPRTRRSAPATRGNQANYYTGIANGPPAEKASSNPDSVHAAWVALRHFGYHVSFDSPTGLKLNGDHIHLDDLMKLTNRVRRDHGMPPVGKKREWLE